MNRNEERMQESMGQAGRPDDSRGRRSARGPVVVLGLFAAVVAGGLWLARQPADDLVQGMADADTINVAAKITARVERLLVREGERVEAGQVLFELDSPEVLAKERQVQATLEAARALAAKADEGARKEDVRAAEANWRRAVAAAELADSTWRRIERLQREGVVTRQKRDEALAQQRNARGAAAAARAQYDLALAGTRDQDKAAALAQVRQAEAGLAEVEVARNEIRGVAPRSAEVGKRLAEEGELVPAGYPVFTLVDRSRMWVSFHLREDQFAGLTIGQLLRGSIPALALDDVAFEVYYISPAGDFATWRATRQSAGYDVRSFEVRVRPVQPVADFRPGMSVLFAWPQAGRASPPAPRQAPVAQPARPSAGAPAGPRPASVSAP
ncbi:MAG: efflux RND transporter periplasmic adaptor subunit [Lautropia sp.]|nr:efflux RND transporter periplasmic adaptor subunit [Lautropia sp.]